jgi:hypothetical protein
MTEPKLISLDDIIEKMAAHPRLRVTFHSHTFAPGGLRDPAAPNRPGGAVAADMFVSGSGLASLMQKIHANGGIGLETPDGTLIWLPWPVAAVTVQAAPDTPSS